MEIRSIWKSNQREEMILIRDCFKRSSFVSVDTEFPGCLRETPMDASDRARYSDMRFNADRTKLIQLGFTLFSAGETICTWEVNFSDFDEANDAKNDRSIAFLKRNGLNFQKIREEGIESREFFHEFSDILKSEEKKIWVFFDGLYDKAYLLKGLTGGKPLPESMNEFAESFERFVGASSDVKKVAGLCKGMTSRYGLQRVANELGITRAGEAHHAGSDSELTARVYNQMLRRLVREDRRQQYSQQERVMTRSYFPVRPQLPPMMFPCYQPRPQHEVMMMPHGPAIPIMFGGHFLVPVQR